MRSLLILSYLLTCGTVCYGRDLYAPPLQISGSKVDTEIAAKRLAFDNYIKKMNGGISATEAVYDMSVVVMGYNVGEFVRKGVEIWEARVADKQELRAIIWINPYTEQAYFVCGPWEEQLTLSPLSIEGTNTSSEAEAKQIARDNYADKMGISLMAEEGVRRISIITLGYDVPDFAKRGEVIWEARVMAFFDRELRAILWINPKTEKVHYLCGPWDEDLPNNVINLDLQNSDKK